MEWSRDATNSDGSGRSGTCWRQLGAERLEIAFWSILRAVKYSPLTVHHPHPPSLSHPPLHRQIRQSTDGSVDRACKSLAMASRTSPTAEQ